MSSFFARPKLIVTLGPSTRTEADLKMLKSRGVNFVRVNMSHASIEDLHYFIALAKKVGLSFIIDTQGSQIRTGGLVENTIVLEENDEIKIYRGAIKGDREKISLTPDEVVLRLEESDTLRLGFDGLMLQVTDVSSLDRGYIMARVVTGGVLGKNKGVMVDSWNGRSYDLPPLTPTDYQSIAIGLKEGIGFITASFMRSGSFVEEVRQATHNSMKIISKIECLDGLRNLDEIIEKSDYLLIDRGDLSKELPLEKLPFAQKIIIQRARKQGKGVFVATNLLETMISSNQPTRAEVHDIVNTIVDGVAGFALVAETAIGKYPIECVNMLNRLINQVQENVEVDKFVDKEAALVNHLEARSFLLQSFSYSNLVLPHGGKLVDRIVTVPASGYLEKLPRILLNQNQLMDLEQIALGTFSPLEGFLGKDDLESVLNTYRLTSGVIWPLPIVLDVSREAADSLQVGREVTLTDSEDQPVAILHLEEKYDLDKRNFAEKLYGTSDEKHPGVRMTLSLQPVFLAGKVDFFRRPKRDSRKYELSPRQVRQIFRERGWSTVVGFHTRNVIHRSHEYIQMQALRDAGADGLFVHPVIGKKKAGDYHAKFIIKSYEIMMKHFYPKGKVVFSTYATFSRYAGPREALFTALCRKNFGCSHFIVGRDHTGVGNFYPPTASHDIFDQFPPADIGIIPIRFGNIFYSEKIGDHVHEKEDLEHRDDEKFHISGTQARKMFESGEVPPSWFMRPEISGMIIDAIKRGEEVFVPKEESAKSGGAVLWFTGLSGSGKTTIAHALKRKMEVRGLCVAVLDGDAVRNSSVAPLGFSREDIRENNRRIAEMSKEAAGGCDVVLVPIISPYAEDRAMARAIIGEGFREVYINASLETCMMRDTKGLYTRAKRGEMNNLIGFSPNTPYEAPNNPDIEVRTDGLAVEESAQILIDFLGPKQSYAQVSA